MSLGSKIMLSPNSRLCRMLPLYMATAIVMCLIIGQADPPARASALAPQSASMPEVTKSGSLSLADCWTIVSSPNPEGYNYLYEIAVTSSTDAWAVGSNYRPNLGVYTLALHWDGSQWVVVPTPSVVNEDVALYGVDAISANDAWAVGNTNGSDGGSTFIIHWDGTQWTRVPSPTVFPSQLLAVSARAANDVWAVGHSGLPSSSRTLIMHWNGSTWSIVPSPNLGASFLYGVKAIAANDVWAVGQYQESGTRTLTLHWDGTAWAVIPNPGPGISILEDVDGTSANNVWAVGNYREGSAPGRTLIMHWNGSTWSIVPSPNTSNEPNLLRGVAAISATNAWAVGYYAAGSETRTLAMQWNGATWTIVPSANAEASSSILNGVDGTTSDNVWAAGPDLHTDNVRPTRTLIERYTAGGCSAPTPTPTPLPPAPTATPSSCTPGTYRDVPPGSTFYPFVTCLSIRGIISGYSDCTFRPNNSVTRGQLAKMVSSAAGFSEPVSGQAFEDVPSTHTFYEWVERLAARGYMTGYVCGGAGEPCVNNRPYFRPQANATRGQTAKIVANSAGFSEPVSGQTFQDVPTNHTFYEFIQRLANRNIMQGYPCGGPGEPCVGGGAYFRPGNDVTRGQSAKIVAGAFFSECNSRTGSPGR